jgi:hypothetical protein
VAGVAWAVVEVVVFATDERERRRQEDEATGLGSCAAIDESADYCHGHCTLGAVMVYTVGYALSGSCVARTAQDGAGGCLFTPQGEVQGGRKAAVQQPPSGAVGDEGASA